jgi:hypothetical protein
MAKEPPDYPGYLRQSIDIQLTGLSGSKCDRIIRPVKTYKRLGGQGGLLKQAVLPPPISSPHTTTARAFPCPRSPLRPLDSKPLAYLLLPHSGDLPLQTNLSMDEGNYFKP